MFSSELYGFPIHDVTRPFLFLFGGNTSLLPALLFFLFVCASAYMVFSLLQRFSVWSVAQGLSLSAPLKERAIHLYSLFFQGKTPCRRAYMVLSHFLLISAALSYLVLGLFYCINVAVSIPLVGTNILTGHLYLIWIFWANVSGLFVLLAVAIQLYTRFGIRPRSLTTNLSHIAVLLLLVTAVVSGYFCEAMRLALVGRPEFEVWAFVAYPLSLLFTSLHTDSSELIYQASWVTHLASFLLLFGGLASRKSYGNIFQLINIGLLPETQSENKQGDYQFDIKEHYGAYSVADFKMHELVACASCTGCGLCQEHCPAVLAETSLSPKSIVSSINRALLDYEKSKELTALVPNYINEAEVRACFNCGACVEVCPSRINHVAIIQKLADYVTLDTANIPDWTIQQYRNLEFNKNSFGKSESKRAEWMSEIDGGVLASSNQSFDYLLFVGCSYSYNKRLRSELAAFLRIMKSAEVKIAVLGNEEICCGDTALRTGNKELFFRSAAENIRMFRKYGVKKIITLCPHGYNTIKNEYGAVYQNLYPGHNYTMEVLHYTELFDTLIAEGRIKFNREYAKYITYHDSCYLGRFNRIFNTPRRVLSSVPGLTLIEMRRHASSAVCCGASGSKHQLQKKLSYKPGEFCAMEGYSSGAQEIVTSCLYCMESIREGIRDVQQQDSVKVTSILQIIDAASK